MKMKEQAYYKFSTDLFSLLEKDEALSIGLHEEETLFIRFTQAKVRQSTDVTQAKITLKFHKNRRVIHFETSYSENYQLDDFKKILSELREDSNSIPEDPHYVPMANNGESSANNDGNIPSSDEVIGLILEPVKKMDFCGVYTGGTVIAANTNSMGQRHWFSTKSFYIDFSIYLPNHKAVKEIYSSTSWNNEEYLTKIESAKQMLEKLSLPTKKIEKGSYRTYLAPAAVNDLFDIFGWGGFSTAAMKQGECPLKKLQDGDAKLSPKFSYQENFEMGLVPRFNASGEVSPTTISIIENGELKELLTSSRSAKEYNKESNNASEEETPRSPIMKTGTLKREEILKELGTGMYLSNVHYVNWSDRQGGRITGMTRYACFWVENGEIVAPIEDLRFDDTIYRFFGDKLEAVTQFAEISAEVETYNDRSIGGKSLPGILLSEFAYTL